MALVYSEVPFVLTAPAVTLDALAAIDLALATCAGRDLVSTSELSDLLLDLRQLLVGGQ